MVDYYRGTYRLDLWKNQKEVIKLKENKKDKLGGLFIPAGLFIGMGVGFLMNQFVAGMFIGLGLGFLDMILYLLVKK